MRPGRKILGDFSKFGGCFPLKGARINDKSLAYSRHRLTNEKTSDWAVYSTSIASHGIKKFWYAFCGKHPVHVTA